MTDPREARPVTPDERERFKAWLDTYRFGATDTVDAMRDAWQASRASQSARIAALETALQKLITDFDAFCKVHWTSGASQDVRRWPWDAARAVLAGDAT